MWCWHCTMGGWYHQMWEKKIKESLNVIKSTVTCGVGIVQCVDGAIKCEKK